MFKFSTQVILGHLDEAIRLDAKQFESFGQEDKLHALQPTLFGVVLAKLRPQPEALVRSLEFGCEVLFSFLNLIDLEKGQSFIFASNIKGTTLASQAFSVSFENGWATLKPPILRKQIIPKLVPLVRQVNFS